MTDEPKMMFIAPTNSKIEADLGEVTGFAFTENGMIVALHGDMACLVATVHDRLWAKLITKLLNDDLAVTSTFGRRETFEEE